MKANPSEHIVYTVPTRYTAAQLVEAHRHASTHPEAVYRPKPTSTGVPVSTDASLDGFYGDLTASQWLAWFRSRLLEKINASDPKAPNPAWRKMSPEWQLDAANTARAVNTPRLVVRWVPRDLRARLAHRLTTSDDT